MAEKNTSTIKREEYLLLAGVFLVELVTRLLSLQGNRVISADGIGYASTALSFFRDGNFSGAAFYPPLYPALVGLCYLTGPDIETAGRIVAIIMGSLMVFPVYLLGVALFNRRVGLMTALLTIVWPSLRSWSTEVMTQSTYITLILMGIYLAWRGSERKSARLCALSGLFMVLAYLTRPEAIIVFVLMSLVLLVRHKLTGSTAREILVFAGTTGAGFALLFIPYVVFVHGITGEWQLTGKTGMALADALSEYLGRPDMKREPGFVSLSFLDVIRMYPHFLWSNSVKNLQQVWQTMLPWYLWVLTLAGFILAGWRREAFWRQLFMLTSFAPLALIVIFFFVGPEYLQPYLPVMFLWTGHGIDRIGLALTSRLPAGQWPRLSNLLDLFPLSVVAVATIALVILAGQLSFKSKRPYHFDDDGGRYDHKLIGLMLKKQLPAKSIIMCKSGRIGFYSELNRVDIPQASLEEILRTAREKKVRYLVVDGMLAGARPQLEVLFRPLFNGPSTVYSIQDGMDASTPIPGVRLYLLYKHPSSLGVAVYELVS
jgi:4-amino-4-deoxy-L-arabinose transferase-like glycosyltransferase